MIETSRGSGGILEEMASPHRRRSRRSTTAWPHRQALHPLGWIIPNPIIKKVEVISHQGYFSGEDGIRESKV